MLFDQVDLFRAKKLEAELDEFRQRNSVSMANLVRWTKKLVNWPTWPTWPGQKSNFLAAMAMARPWPDMRTPGPKHVLSPDTRWPTGDRSRPAWARPLDQGPGARAIWTKMGRLFDQGGRLKCLFRRGRRFKCLFFGHGSSHMASHGQRHVVVRGCLSHIFPKSAYLTRPAG